MKQGDFQWPASIVIIWVQAASVLFLFAYFNLLLFWAEFYYNVDGSYNNVNRRMRVCSIVTTFFMAMITIVFVALALLWMDNNELAYQLDEISSIVLCVLAILVGCAFLYYGIRLYILLHQYKHISPKKRAQTTKVVGVAVGCTICFLTRAAIVFYSVVEASKNFNRGFDAPWFVVFIFFFALETIPICLMLFLLRKLPNWKSHGTKPLLDSP